MNPMNLHDLKFPIGEFIKPTTIQPSDIQHWIQDIALFPERANRLTENLDTTALNWQYRPEGWTIKQVVHHCADSHMNALIRCKLTITENNPTIRPYYEDRWANLTDSLSDDLSYSLALLKGLHHKWTTILSTLNETELSRSFVHPEHNETFTLKENIANYAWHCNHHLAHIRQAIKHKGIFNPTT